MDDNKFGYPYHSGGYDPQYRGGYAQPPYQRPPYPPTQQSNANMDGTQILTGEGFKPLSKEERDEAARIAAETGFSFTGYQVVRREFFSHKFDPTLTIRNNGIIFNNACISKLDEVVYVQVLINPDSGKLVIRPCDEGARDAVRWCITKEDKRKSRQISCSMFTAKLYDMMGWQTLYRYKMQGTRIDYQGEKLYVFDLTSTEIFIPTTKESTDPNEKPKKKLVSRFQADWRDSFGLPVDAHERSTQINLAEGFDMVDIAPVADTEQVQMELNGQATEKEAQ